MINNINNLLLPAALLVPQIPLVGGLLLIVQFVIIMLCQSYPFQDPQKQLAELMAKKKHKS